MEKENNKNKAKFETTIAELNKELDNNKAIFAEHEKSLAKSMENQLIAKEKKVTDLRNELNLA